MSASGKMVTAMIGIGAAILLSATAINIVYPPFQLDQMNGYGGLNVFLVYLVFGGGGAGLLYLFYRRAKTSNLNSPKRTV